jgi:hypothetical protein
MPSCEGAGTDALARSLDELGYAVIPQFVDASLAAVLRAQFDRDELFRSTVDMARHGYGRGSYRYYRYPLPRDVAELRTWTYRRLAPIANVWAERLGRDERYPDDLDAMLARCAAAYQTRCTILQLRYRAGDHNALHRDRYGEIAFPLQVAVVLNRPGDDFDGGEFVLVEQRPRKQSIATAIALGLGDAIVFPNDIRPTVARDGRVSRISVRHGVSRVTRGERRALGLIFHDAP